MASKDPPPTTTPTAPAGGVGSYDDFIASGAGGGVVPAGQVLSEDLMNYLRATGQINEPRWQRVINSKTTGEHPIGSTSYGWQGDDTPILNAGVDTSGYMGPVANRSVTGNQDYMGPVANRTPAAGNQDYMGPVANRTSTSQIPLVDVRPPIYFDGDEDVEYSKMSPEQRASVKQFMRDAGMISPTGGGIGQMWDTSAYNAFTELLRYSNAKGVSWRGSMASMKSYLAEHPEEVAKPKGATLPAFTPNVTNPQDLRKVFEQAATKIAGGKGVDPATVDRFVQTYQQEQVRSQQQAYSATYAPGETGVGPGGTVTNAPDPSVAAENLLRQTNPTETGAADISNVMGSFLNIIGRAGG